MFARCGKTGPDDWNADFDEDGVVTYRDKQKLGAVCMNVYTGNKEFSIIKDKPVYKHMLGQNGFFCTLGKEKENVAMKKFCTDKKPKVTFNDCISILRFGAFGGWFNGENEKTRFMFQNLPISNKKLEELTKEEETAKIKRDKNENEQEDTFEQKLEKRLKLVESRVLKPQTQKFTRQNCAWSGYVNGWDGAMNYKCPNDGFIAGSQSYHSNHHEDRRWKFYCCKPKSSFR